MNASEIDKAVDEFDAARERGEYFPRAWSDRLSIDDAYRVQLGLIRRRCATTKQRRIGWKVGLTARAIQQQFGFDEPVFGCLLEEGKVSTGHAFKHARLIRPGFENELCVDLCATSRPARPSRPSRRRSARSIPRSRSSRRAATSSARSRWRSPTTPSNSPSCSGRRSGPRRRAISRSWWRRAPERGRGRRWPG